MRDTIAYIDLSALVHNIQCAQDQSLKTVFPVVKANAYGHGMLEVARFLDDQDQRYICVSSIDEAVVLYENGIKSSILIFSYVSKQDIEIFHHEQFVYTVTSMNHLQELESLSFQILVHLEINCGMNRYGIKPRDYISSVKSKHVIEGIYTHFSSNEVNQYTINQARLFREFVMGLDSIPSEVHVGNAPIELIKNESYINGLRLGLGMFGYRNDIKGLTPVLRLNTRINHIDKLLAGESLGYDQTYIAKSEELFATIPIGYGDGFDMRNNNSPVFIKNRPYPIIGKICMDQTMVLVDQSISRGEMVELIGPSRTLMKISSDTDISPYVILTSLSERIKRIYKK